MAIRLEGDLAISSGTTVRALIERAVISAHPPHTVRAKFRAACQPQQGTGRQRVTKRDTRVYELS